MTETDRDIRTSEIESRDLHGVNPFKNLSAEETEKLELDPNFVASFFSNPSPSAQNRHLTGLTMLARSAAMKFIATKESPEDQTRDDSITTRIFQEIVKTLPNTPLLSIVAALHAEEGSRFYETALTTLENAKLYVTDAEQQEIAVWRLSFLEDLRNEKNHETANKKTERLSFLNTILGDRLRAKQKKTKELTQEILNLAKTRQTPRTENEIATRVDSIHTMLHTEFSITSHLKLAQPLMDTWKESLRALAPIKSKAVIRSLESCARNMAPYLVKHQNIAADFADAWTANLAALSGRQALEESFRAVFSAPNGGLASRMEGAVKTALQNAPKETLFQFGHKIFNPLSKLIAQDKIGGEVERRLGRLGAMLTAAWKGTLDAQETPVKSQNGPKSKRPPVKKFEPFR